MYIKYPIIFFIFTVYLFFLIYGGDSINLSSLPMDTFLTGTLYLDFSGTLWNVLIKQFQDFIFFFTAIANKRTTLLLASFIYGAGYVFLIVWVMLDNSVKARQENISEVSVNTAYSIYFFIFFIAVTFLLSPILLKFASFNSFFFYSTNSLFFFCFVYLYNYIFIVYTSNFILNRVAAKVTK